MSRAESNGKKPAAVSTTRCAIYTRKSSDEGLQQEFNSLDAQREAAEAYVASQKAEGWVCLPDHYDDGGFTGGNMERPGLQRLLTDISAGENDCPDDDDQDDDEGDDGDEDGDDGDGDGDGECDGKGDAGDALHIHLTTGNIWTTIPIFRMYAAGGHDLDFKLRYDSIRAQENGPLGWGWTHSYNIYVQQIGNKVIYHEGNGRRSAFTLSGGTYAPPIGRAFQLVWVGDHFELNRTNGTREIFNPAGRISEIIDRRGARRASHTTVASSRRSSARMGGA